MPERNLSATRLSYVWDVLAGILALLILMAAAGGNSFILAPGMFLFERFHLASLYIPGLVFFCGFLIRSGSFPRRTRILTWLSLLPFLTLAVFLQVATGNTGVLVSRLLLDGMGRYPATALLFLFLVLEVLGLFRLSPSTW